MKKQNKNVNNANLSIVDGLRSISKKKIGVKLTAQETMKVESSLRVEREAKNPAAISITI